MKLFTKEELVEELRVIRAMGWVKNARPGNDGGVGNTLEDLLGIEENNLPIPNAAEWELKCQRHDSNSLGTLFHIAPSPRSLRLLTTVLLPKYGWRHREAGLRYPETEMSFRQTLSSNSRSDRGFTIHMDRVQRKFSLSFDAQSVSARHVEWLSDVTAKVGLGELNPQPYWGFDDVIHKAGTKLGNCFFIVARRKQEGGVELFWYETMYMLQGFSGDRLLQAIEDGRVLIDIDARTGHDHGPKFRVRQISDRCALYEKYVII